LCLQSAHSNHLYNRETTKEIVIDVEPEDEEMKGGSDEDADEKIDTVNPLNTSATEKLAQDEELVYDNSAYEMIHRANVEWPSLTIDILTSNRFDKSSYDTWFPDHVHTLNPEESRTETIKYPDDYVAEITKHTSDTYPYEAYVVAGSQALKKKDNKVYVMKWCNLTKTLHDDDDDAVEDDEAEDDAKLYYEPIPHMGGVNRIRAMHGSNIVATWSDTGDVSILDLTEAIKRVDKKAKSKTNVTTQRKFSSLISKFNHKVEGFALDWSPKKLGLLASGSCDKLIYIYEPTGADLTEFIMHDKPLRGHMNSVEDIQFSPTQEHVLASCSVDRTIKLWDLRTDKWKAQMSFRAHDADVNVISWNSECKYLLASGSDDGSFKVWDLRKLQKDDEAKPITNIKWHNGPITSIHFQPREECVLAVASADNKISMWDFSVEPDKDEPVDQEIPPQLMF
jgi:ribosome assembly protein RRB1